jgi:hypothetical protein
MTPNYSTSRKCPTIYDESDMENFFKVAMNNISHRKLESHRNVQKVKILAPMEAVDDDAPELFVANPSDDIPRNKLTE